MSSCTHIAYMIKAAHQVQQRQQQGGRSIDGAGDWQGGTHIIHNTNSSSNTNSNTNSNANSTSTSTSTSNSNSIA